LQAQVRGGAAKRGWVALKIKFDWYLQFESIVNSSFWGWRHGGSLRQRMTAQTWTGKSIAGEWWCAACFSESKIEITIQIQIKIKRQGRRT